MKLQLMMMYLKLATLKMMLVDDLGTVVTFGADILVAFGGVGGTIVVVLGVFADLWIV